MLRFDQRARRYAKHAGVQRQMAGWLAEWLPDVAGGTALEYGAGEGMFTREAVAQFDSMTSIDVAPGMVAAGRENLPRANWAVGDAWRGDGPELVDSILSASFLQWAPEPETVFRVWRRKLKLDGKMLHGFYVAPTLPELNALIGEEAGPLQWRSPDVWCAALEVSGFRVAKQEADARVFRYPGALDLLRSLHGVGAVRQGGPAGASLRKVIREYDARHRAADGVASTWTFCRVLAIAV
ncbi:MAG: class I SAM-dependent methyltransferase [Puniceicoccales bacterium]